MSARRIITMILSFLFLAAVILCGYTPILPQVAPGSVEAAGPGIAGHQGSRRVPSGDLDAPRRQMRGVCLFRNVCFFSLHNA